MQLNRRFFTGTCISLAVALVSDARDAGSAPPGTGRAAQVSHGTATPPPGPTRAVGRPAAPSQPSRFIRSIGNLATRARRTTNTAISRLRQRRARNAARSRSRPEGDLESSAELASQAVVEVSRVSRSGRFSSTGSGFFYQSVNASGKPLILTNHHVAGSRRDGANLTISFANGHVPIRARVLGSSAWLTDSKPGTGATPQTF